MCNTKLVNKSLRNFIAGANHLAELDGQTKGSVLQSTILQANCTNAPIYLLRLNRNLKRFGPMPECRVNIS